MIDHYRLYQLILTFFDHEILLPFTTDQLKRAIAHTDPYQGLFTLLFYHYHDHNDDRFWDFWEVNKGILRAVIDDQDVIFVAECDEGFFYLIDSLSIEFNHISECFDNYDLCQTMLNKQLAELSLIHSLFTFINHLENKEIISNQEAFRLGNFCI